MSFSMTGPFSRDRSILSDAGRTIGGHVLRNEITSDAIVTSDAFGTVAAGEITVAIEIGEDASWLDTMRLFDGLVEQIRREFLTFLVEEKVR